MSKWCVVVVLALLASAQASVARATWLWDNSVLDNAVKREDVLRFCAARRIGVIFLYGTAGHLHDRAASFRVFLAAAHARHIEIQALGGEADWEAKDAGDFASAVVAFNDAGQPAERFDAIHLDVEPYNAPGWKQDATVAAQQYLALLDLARARARGLPLAADVPPWFGSVTMPDGTLLSEAILRVDELGLMVYTDEARRLKADSEPAVELAARHGKKVWIGVSAQAQDSKRQRAVTLRAQVEHRVKHAGNLFADSPGLRGVAIHDYAHLRALYRSR